MISLLIYTRNIGAALPRPAWRRPAAQPIGIFYVGLFAGLEVLDQPVAPLIFYSLSNQPNSISLSHNQLVSTKF